MNPPKKKRPLKKARNRKKSSSFNLTRFLSYILLLLVLTFSVCALGYVIFFRTVIAREIPIALGSTTVFEEPDPQVHEEELKIKPIGVKVVDAIEKAATKNRSELPKVAIIFDDMGYNEAIGEQLLKFPIEVTYSFLPFAPHTRKLERLAHRAGKTVFLHLPLEPKNSSFNPGPGALYLQDTPETQREKFEKCLQEVPHAIGVNTHMGSLFTEDKSAMANIIQEVRNRSLLFVDSFTTPGSVGLQSARQASVKSMGRNVFLDNVLNEEKICAQLEQLVIMSERNGKAIGIGHPHRETVDAVLRCGEKYRGRVQYVGARDVL